MPWVAWKGNISAVKHGVIAFCLDVSPKELILAGEDKFGEVIAGTISVTGRMLQCKLGDSTLMSLEFGPMRDLVPLHDELDGLAVFHPDGNPESWPHDSEFACLLLAYHDGSNIRHQVGFESITSIQDNSRPRYFGLVLQPVDDLRNTYRRVGMAIAESNRHDVGAGLQLFLSSGDTHVFIV
jgi:hypothetical protein